MKEFHQMREKFHPHKLIWVGYLVYSLSNCATKLCIETGLMQHATLGSAR